MNQNTKKFVTLVSVFLCLMLVGCRQNPTAVALEKYEKLLQEGLQKQQAGFEEERRKFRTDLNAEAEKARNALVGEAKAKADAAAELRKEWEVVNQKKQAVDALLSAAKLKEEVFESEKKKFDAAKIKLEVEIKPNIQKLLDERDALLLKIKELLEAQKGKKTSAVQEEMFKREMLKAGRQYDALVIELSNLCTSCATGTPPPPLLVKWSPEVIDDIYGLEDKKELSELAKAERRRQYPASNGNNSRDQVFGVPQQRYTGNLTQARVNRLNYYGGSR